MEIHRYSGSALSSGGWQAWKVVVSLVIAIYPEFSFLPNLDLSSALFIFIQGDLFAY